MHCSHDLMIRKSNFHYTRGITPKRMTSGGVHIRGLVPGQHSSDETSQRWRAVGDTASDLSCLGDEPRPPAPLAISTTPAGRLV